MLLSLAVFAMVFFVEEWFSALYHAMVPGPPAPDFVDDGKVAGYGPFTLAGRKWISLVDNGKNISPFLAQKIVF